jgi:ADP-ribosyl-[dinitrogen reductase] hydrolase
VPEAGTDPEEAAPVTTPTSLDRTRGSLVGLAAGDALGATIEFSRPGTFTAPTEIVGGGPFELRAGEWTDDTAMALCLADSLVSCKGFDARDQAERYVRWHRDGLWASNDRGSFSIGGTTRGALEHFLKTGEPTAPNANDASATGNGSLMRLAPAPLAFAREPLKVIEYAAQSSRVTHARVECVDACRYFAALVVGALQDRGRDELTRPFFEPEGAEGIWQREPLCAAIAEIAGGSFKEREPPVIQGIGHAVRTLEAALWSFAGADDFAGAVRRAVALGDDADTTAAVTGQLAGAVHGYSGIPERWRRILARESEIVALADGLHALADAAGKRGHSAVSGPQC